MANRIRHRMPGKHRRASFPGRLLLAVTGTLLLLSAAKTAASPSGPASRAYVTNFLSNSVSVIDTSTNAVVATVDVGAHPVAVAVTPDGNRAYVANSRSNNVSVIATDSVIATLGVGSNPSAIAVTPDGSRAYVANADSNNVSVIDVATNAVVATVGVGTAPAGVAITPDGSRAYVTNRNSSSVSVIRTDTNAVVATVASVTSRPGGIAITPNGADAYVTDTSSFNVAVISTATNTVVGGLTVGGDLPFTVAISPDGKRAYTANLAGNVSVIDTGSNAFLVNVPVGSFPRGVALTPDGSFAYVTNQSSDNLSIIDTATNTVVTTFTMTAGSQPYGIAIAPAPSVPPPPLHPPAPRAYVSNRSGSVSVLDTETNTVVATIPTGDTTPFGVAVSPRGNRAYVTNQATANVLVIDTGPNLGMLTVPVGPFPTGVAVTPDGSRVYVANHTNGSFNPSTVSVIDTATNTVVATVGVGIQPWGVAITPDGSRAYVTNENSSNVSVIRTDTNAVVATVPVGFTPHGVAITPDGSRAYVANFNSGTVSVIRTDFNTVTATVAVGSVPNYVAVSPDGSRVYVGTGSGVAIIATANNTVLTTLTSFVALGLALGPDGSRVYVVDGSFQNVRAIDTVTLANVGTATAGTNPEGVAMGLAAISIDNVSVTRGTSGATDATFTVVLSAASARTITVEFATVDGTAIAGNDYLAQSGTLTFNPGETSKQISVPVNGTTSVGPDQTFFVNLSNPTNASLAKARGVGTIINNNVLPGLSIDDVSVGDASAGTTNATFTVTLSAPSAQPVTVDFATADGTAVSGSDYVANSSTLSFAPGETSKQIVVGILGGTGNASDKTFFVNLSNPTRSILVKAQGAGTITSGGPVLGPLPDLTVAELTAIAFTAVANDPPGHTLTFSFGVPPPAGATLTGTGTFAWTPALGQASTYSIAIKVTDERGLSDQKTFSIVVTPASHAPIARDDRIQGLVATDLSLRFGSSDLLANDTDPDGHALTVIVVQEPQHGSLVTTPSNDGSIAFTYTPVEGFFGSDSFFYVASDGTLTSNPAVVQLAPIRAGKQFVLPFGSISATPSVLPAQVFLPDGPPPNAYDPHINHDFITYSVTPDTNWNPASGGGGSTTGIQVATRTLSAIRTLTASLLPGAGGSVCGLIQVPAFSALRPSGDGVAVSRSCVAGQDAWFVPFAASGSGTLIEYLALGRATGPPALGGAWLAVSSQDATGARKVDVFKSGATWQLAKSELGTDPVVVPPDRLVAWESCSQDCSGILVDAIVNGGLQGPTSPPLSTGGHPHSDGTWLVAEDAPLSDIYFRSLDFNTEPVTVAMPGSFQPKVSHDVIIFKQQLDGQAHPYGATALMMYVISTNRVYRLGTGSFVRDFDMFWSGRLSDPIRVVWTLAGPDQVIGPVFAADFFVPSVTADADTPAGSGVVVTPIPAVSLQFENVTTAGVTTVVTKPSPSLPSHFSVGGMPVDIETTATFSGAVTVCFHGSFQSELPILSHFENGQWIDVTISSTATEVCGRVTAFSPFAVLFQSNNLPTVDADPPQIVEATSAAGATVAVNASAADIDGDSLALTWSEGDTELGTGVHLLTTLPVGVHALKIQAEDGLGGEAVAFTTVTVHDTTPPVVTPPASVTVPAMTASGTRPAAWPALAAFLAGATAHDAVDPAPQASITVNGVQVTADTLFPIGTTTQVTFSYRDASGNVGTATSTVSVVLGTPRMTVSIVGSGTVLGRRQFVDLEFRNDGTGVAQSVVAAISCATSAGQGETIVVPPAADVLVGDLVPGAARSVRILVNVPNAVQQVTMLESVRFANVLGTGDVSLLQEVYAPPQ